MVDITASLDAATQQILALMAQIRLSNCRLVQAQDIGAADAYVFAPVPNVPSYGADLVLVADIATPNLTTTPKLTIQGLVQVPIQAADGSAPAIGTVAGKRLIGFSSVTGGGFVARLLGTAPADFAAYLAGLPRGMQIITSTGSFNPVAGATGYRVRFIGAGAGGGASAPSPNGTGGGGGGGGASGSYSERLFAASEITAAVAVTIGTPGSGGNASSGGNGTVSSFGTFMTIPGGLAGSYGVNANQVSGGSPGGVPTGGQININGGIGGASLPFAGGAGAPAPMGGSWSPYPFQGQYNATGPGAGGSGGSPDVGGRTGGAGGGALCIVEVR